jgi:hypothetical protein
MVWVVWLRYGAGSPALTIDLHEYLEGPHYSPPGPHPITKEDLPRTFGHEFAGGILQLRLLIQVPFWKWDRT